MSITFAQPYEDLTFLSPLSDERAAQLVRFLAEDLHGTVLDFGCGWAQLLCRAVAATPDARGVGIDTDEASIEHGRQLAEDVGLSDRVSLICGDVLDRAPERADAVVCIGASQIWGPPVEDNQPLDYSSALTAIRSAVPRGARVLYGEGVWSRPPTAAAVAPLAGRSDELVPLAELIDLAVAAGFMPLEVHEATIDEWDRFESGFSAGYLGGYRGVVGMAYLALLAL